MRGSLLLAGTAAVAACALTACGSNPAGGSPGPATRSPGTPVAARCSWPVVHLPGRTITLTNSANGKSVCVRRGTRIYVFLHGSQSRRWAPIEATSPVLTRVPSGVLTLMIGVTGGFFQAKKTGTAELTSTRAPCLQKHALCSRQSSFRVTVQVSG
jgi:hypothetical protein